MHRAGRLRGPFWYQLPVHSPLTLAGLSAGLQAATGLKRDGAFRLREHLAAEHGSERALLFGSGTAALQVALELALNRAVRSGGERSLALPAYSCFDVASGAAWTHARLHFYDLNPDTLSPDLTSLRRAFEAGASVLLACPLFGLPLQWDALREITREYGATIVHDAAQAFGLRMDGGQGPGAFGDLVVLSFGKGKGWTGGRGGAVLLPPGSEVEGIADFGSATISDEGRVILGAAAQWLLGRPQVYGGPVRIPWLKLGETIYHPPRAPRPMTRAAAGIVLAGRAASEREVVHRVANARDLLSRLSESPGLRAVGMHQHPGAAFLRLPLLGTRGMHGFPSPERARRLGVSPGYPLPLPELPSVSGPASAVESWPGAKLLSEGLITMPTHSRLRPGDIEDLIELASEYGG